MPLGGAGGVFLGSISQDSQIPGSTDGLGAAVHVKLSIDVSEVFLECAGSNNQRFSDLLVGQIRRKEPQHFLLAWRQLFGEGDISAK